MTVFTATEHIAPVTILTKNIGDQALDLNATLNKITTTIAGVWDLDTENKTAQNSSGSGIFVAHKNPGSESVVEGDDRTLVDPEHFAPSGKYRCEFWNFKQESEKNPFNDDASNLKTFHQI